MREWRMKTTALLLLSLLLAACGSETPPPDLSGKWKFRTTGDYDGYLVGTMKVGVDESGAPTCSMTAFQSEFGSASEACFLSWEGDELRISVKIISNTRGNWRPESYVLHLEDGKLVGTVKKLKTYSVVFTRK